MDSLHLTSCPDLSATNNTQPDLIRFLLSTWKVESSLFHISIFYPLTLLALRLF